MKIKVWLLISYIASRYKLLKWRILAILPIIRGRSVTTKVRGKKMYLDLADKTHCETLYTRGAWEEAETSFLKRIIKDGMVVVDVGANVGYYTLLASDYVGKNGRVFAFEPDPSRYELLVRNIRVNQCNNVELIQKAVSNRGGHSRLFYGLSKNKGDQRLYSFLDSRESVEVETIRLDDFFNQINLPVHVVKMDIQGFEYAALEGMSGVINKNRDLTLISEYFPEGMSEAGSSPQKFLDELVRNGFRLSLLNNMDHSLKQVTPADILKRTEPALNLVCIKDGV